MKRLLKRFAFVLVALIAILGVTFWLRPLAVFGAFSEAHMYSIGARSDFVQVEGYCVHVTRLDLQTVRS